MNYLGSYLKKPPISGSRLAHYSASPTLSFTYLDHRTHTYQQETLSQADMLRRGIQHIPKKHFRMIRVSGQPHLWSAVADRLPGAADGKA